MARDKPAPGIVALRERRSKRRASREKFYGENPTASEHRKARNRGESPRFIPIVRGGRSGPRTEVIEGPRAFRNDANEAAFRAYKAQGGPLGPKTWWKQIGKKAAPKAAPKMAPAAYRQGTVPAEDLAAARAAGSRYGVDPKLLNAIAAHETGFGRLGQGRRGLTLGVGAYDSGAVSTWAGKQRQYEKAAELLARWGANSIADVMAGRAARYATDPGWESKVRNWYGRL